MLATNNFYYLGLIVLLPLIGALINGLIGSKLPKKIVNLIACGSILGSFFLSLLSIKALVVNAVTSADGQTVYGHLSYTAYQWMYSGGFGVDIAFMIDPLTSMMLLLITGVGFLIHLYSTGYMADDESHWRYFSYLNLFCFAMLILVLGKNMLVTFIGWEGVGVCSYLLIGFWYTDADKAKAGQKAFIVNRVGDFAFLIGMFILFYETGTIDYLQMKDVLTNSSTLISVVPVATAAVILIFIGCTGKSAQIPLFTWLPDAMAGPTPVSALIHAATMVTAGVFLLSRLNFLVTLSWQAMMVIAWVGAFTAFFAATIAIVQNDIKKVLAYSTVSQLGYMFLAVGVGAFDAAVFHVMTHAFFKALMFLGSGSVIHAMHHEQDIRKMGGLKKYMPWTARTFLVGCLAISGIPLFSGFFSKDLILWRALSNVHLFQTVGVDGKTTPQVVSSLVNTVSPVIQSGSAVDITTMAAVTAYGTFILGVLTAFMTAFYMFRLYFMTFEGECRADEHTKSHLHESPATMTIPLVVLAILSAIGGLTGWPHFAAKYVGKNWSLFFEHWYSEVFAISTTYRIVGRFGEHPYAQEVAVTVGSIIIAFSGIALAWLMYIKNPSLPESLKEKAFGRLHGVLMNKYYVDEGYDTMFVQSSIKTGKGMTFFDKHILDSVFVNGAGHTMATAGRILRHLQSGDVQRYAIYITIAIVIALLALLSNVI